MTVYLVPVGPRRYQLYVEVTPGADEPASVPAGTGWFARQVQKFRATLAEAEHERLRRESGESAAATGLWRTLLAKIAETIAEQRLLWHLRHQTHVTVEYPDDLGAEAALAEVRAEFARDVAKHRRWFIIDGLIVAVTGPLLFFFPGPNVVSWYFTIRAIGHLFSWRGASKGLTAVRWETAASPQLSRVRAALLLPVHERRLQLVAIGAELGLGHLAGFVDRVSARRE
jgi:hypothetical protein